MKFPARGTKTVNGKRYKTKPRSKKTPSKSLRTAIQKAIYRNQETKTFGTSANNLALSVYTPATQTMTVYNCTDVLSGISQSAGEGGRIGNKINVTKCYLKGFLNIFGTPVTTNIYVRMIVLRVKQDLQTPNGTLSLLYQFGNNSLPPDGTLRDMMRPINRDYFTVFHDKQVLLGSNDAVTSVLPMNNSIGSYRFSFDLTKALGGTVIYSDGASLPTNKACYLLFVPCNANGSAITSVQMSPYLTSVDTEVFYKDA